MEVHYTNNSYPYSTAGSFMEYFEGLTYDHVNFIFFGASHAQETIYPSINTSHYKSGYSDSWSTSYFDNAQSYQVNGHGSAIDEHRRLQLSTIPDEQSSGTRVWEVNANLMPDNNMECRMVKVRIDSKKKIKIKKDAAGGTQRHHNYHEYQTIWQDIVDPDNMTHEKIVKLVAVCGCHVKIARRLVLAASGREELIDLGEAVGTQSRGLTQELIALLPVSKYKCGFFSRKKSRDERCVICQMEYKRGDRMITLPCKHRYHTGCGTKWLSINKACPICYYEVFGDTSKH